MTETDPVDLLFAGMDNLGPGSDAHSINVLRRLPPGPYRVVVDTGCGTGRQTLALARALDTVVDAVDSHKPFLDQLDQRAAQAGLAALVRTHHLDMAGVAAAFPRIDLLWSEGAAYNIGFARALAAWRPALRPAGVAVVSELAWLRDDPPPRVRAFFQTGYPDMRHTRDNIAVAQRSGFRVLDTYPLPDEAWRDGFYDLLAPRARSLAEHADPAVRDYARETLREIETFEAADGSYGYVFYLMSV